MGRSAPPSSPRVQCWDTELSVRWGDPTWCGGRGGSISSFHMTSNFWEWPTEFVVRLLPVTAVYEAAFQLVLTRVAGTNWGTEKVHSPLSNSGQSTPAARWARMPFFPGTMKTTLEKIEMGICPGSPTTNNSKSVTGRAMANNYVDIFGVKNVRHWLTSACGVAARNHGTAEFNRSLSLAEVVQADRTVQELAEEFAVYWLTWWVPQNNNIAGARKLMCVWCFICLRVHWQMPPRACDMMLLFCGIVLVFVRPSCKSIYRVYITKQANNKTPLRPVA